MLRELINYIKTVTYNKITHEKQELEHYIWFWLLKGALCVLALVFLVMALFNWLTIYTEVYCASLIVALLSLLVSIIINSIQAHCHKKQAPKDESLQLLIPLIETFIEGLNCAHKEKNKPTEGAAI